MQQSDNVSNVVIELNLTNNRLLTSTQQNVKVWTVYGARSAFTYEPISFSDYLKDDVFEMILSTWGYGKKNRISVF